MSSTSTTSAVTTEPVARTAAARLVAGARAPARKFIRTRYWPLALGVLVAAVAVYAAFGRLAGGPGAGSPERFTVGKRDFAVTLLEKGELQATKSVDVRCEVEGRSTIIWLIPEGTEVKKGDLLVRLASDEIDERLQTEEITEANTAARLEAAEKELEIQIDQNASDIRKAELALQNAQIELEKYVEGDWVQAKMDADLEIKRATEQLERAEADWTSAEELYEKKFITRSEYLADRFQMTEADNALKKANLALKVLESYTHPKDLRQKQSDVEEAAKDLDRVKKSAAAKEAQKRADVDARRAELGIARQRLTKYREQQRNTKIVAPADGLVVYFNEWGRWGSEDTIKEGSEIRERQTIITLPDTSQMKVQVRIHEATATKIAMDLPAAVEIEGFPSRVFTGKVTKVAPLADSQNRWLNPDLKEYATEITLDTNSVALKPGVTARAEIRIDEVKNALAVPVQAVFSKAGKHYVFRVDGDDAEPVEVRLGPSSSEFARIDAGIAEGEVILLAAADELKQKLPEPGGEATNGEPPTPTPEVARAAEAPAPAPQAQPSAPESSERRDPAKRRGGPRADGGNRRRG